MTTKRILAGLAVTAGLATGAAALAGAEGDEPLPPVPPATQPADPKDGLLAHFGMTRADSRPGFVLRSGKQLHLARTATVSCVVDADGGGHCGPRAALDRGLGFGGEMCRPDLPDDEVRITGVVPDDVTRVTLTLDGGRTVTATPARTTVGFEVPREAVGGAVSVTMTGERGDHRIKVPQPPMVGKAVCG
jgi:hypothetical protein